jgi:ATP-dependent exoDNAse (exonuclease V) beta subunit
MEFADEHFEESLHALIEQHADHSETEAEILRLQNTLTEFLSTPEIKPWFTPKEGRTILNEQEFVSTEGGLFRMDRIVIDANIVTVIDFKTGDDKKGYTEQVQKYMNILKGYFPGRRVQGVLAFVDKKNLRVVV